MRALLDSNAFLWFLLDDARLSETAKGFITDTLTGTDLTRTGETEQRKSLQR